MSDKDTLIDMLEKLQAEYVVDGNQVAVMVSEVDHVYTYYYLFDPDMVLLYIHRVIDSRN